MSILKEGGISPFKVEVEIRGSLKRIAVKDKSKRLKSLTFFKTKNPSFHFFHNDHFIFIELPQYKLAVFYFLKREFKSEKQLGKAVYEVIEQHYN